MRTLAVLPVKSFGDAKQRLGDLLAGGARRALAQAMLSDVLAALRRVQELDGIVVVTADRTAESAATLERVSVIRDVANAGQSAATARGIDYARAYGFDRALLVPGDTPLLDPSEVDELLRRSAADGVDVVIVPDRHGTGTNALLLTPPEAIQPAFGEDSLERHVAAATGAGLRHRVDPIPSLLHDVDTPDDLAELATQLETRHGLAPVTRGALTQLDRVRERGAPTPPRLEYGSV